MKPYQVLFLVLLTSITSVGKAQKGTSFQPSSFIEPFRLEVAYNKTSHLLFPGPITSIDRGSQDILVGKAEGVDNILRIKAATKTFEETNLSVITRDGQLYSFLVCYNPTPSYLNVVVSMPGEPPLKSVFSKVGSDVEAPEVTATKSTYAQKILAAKANGQRKAKKAMMQADLTGLFVADHTLYFRLQLENTSAIAFPMDRLRFSLQDKKSTKRTASQEVELHHQTLYGDSANIPAQSTATWIVTLPAFTIPEGKYLKIEMLEASGGRYLSLRLRNRHILRASPLEMEPIENQ
jgi:conjugative transposon TraN protein